MQDAADTHVRFSPRSGNLVLGYGGPRRVAGTLLLELPIKDFLDVVHVKRTNRRAGDAGEI